MMAITVVDVVLRYFSLSMAGAYDLVKVLSAVSLSCALPYTTAVKGHVAIEFFFHKFGQKGRVVVDSIMRILSSALFGFLTFRSFLYGIELYENGSVTQTLQMPIFWVPQVISFCAFIVMLVILYNLVSPKKEMIKL